jgi:hypothetical protein
MNDMKNILRKILLFITSGIGNTILILIIIKCTAFMSQWGFGWGLPGKPIDIIDYNGSVIVVEIENGDKYYAWLTLFNIYWDWKKYIPEEHDFQGYRFPCKIVEFPEILGKVRDCYEEHPTTSGISKAILLENGLIVFWSPYTEVENVIGYIQFIIMAGILIIALVIVEYFYIRRHIKKSIVKKKGLPNMRLQATRPKAVRGNGFRLDEVFGKMNQMFHNRPSA